MDLSNEYNTEKMPLKVIFSQQSKQEKKAKRKGSEKMPHRGKLPVEKKIEVVESIMQGRDQQLPCIERVRPLKIHSHQLAAAV